MSTQLRRRGAGDAAAAGFAAVAAEVSPSQLRQSLSFPPTFGPTEFGPIPFLPDPDLLVQRMEAAWGQLERYRGINTTAQGVWPHASAPVAGKCWLDELLLSLEEAIIDQYRLPMSGHRADESGGL